MEKELNELRAQVAAQTAQTSPIQSSNRDSPNVKVEEGSTYTSISHNNPYLGNHEAVAGLLDLRQGLDTHGSSYGRNLNGPSDPHRRLGAVSLSISQVSELFEQ